MAIEFTAVSDYGQTGQYVARLTGRAPRVSFSREFLGRKSGKRNDITTALIDDPGLYEVVWCKRKGKERAYWLVVEHDGELRQLRSDEEDCLAIAKRFDGGEFLEQILAIEVVDVEPELLAKYPDSAKTKLVYVIRNKAEAKKAVASATIDTAVAAIVNALDALPAAQQKQALAAAKARLFPKAEPAKLD